LVAAGALTLAFAFTRQAQLIPAGAFAAAWVGAFVKERRAANSWWAPAAAVVGVSAAAQVWQLLVYPFDQVGQLRSKVGGGSAWETLAAWPRHAYSSARFDFIVAVREDPGMVVAMAVLGVALIYGWSRVEIHLALGAGLAGWIYQAVNGSIRLEFRYLEPGFFLYALAGAVLLSALGRGLPQKSKPEPEPEPEPAETVPAG
jgi:hypothetical protein